MMIYFIIFWDGSITVILKICEILLKCCQNDFPKIEEKFNIQFNSIEIQ